MPSDRGAGPTVLFQVPHDASRREIEATEEFAAFLHLIDGGVCERHDEPEFVPPDGAFIHDAARGKDRGYYCPRMCIP
jgi:hypothetical protein